MDDLFIYLFNKTTQSSIGEGGKHMLAIHLITGKQYEQTN